MNEQPAPTGIVNDIPFPFDPRDDAFRADPYPTYNRIREETPVLRTGFGAWVVSRYRDTVYLLHHPETSNDQRNSSLFKAYVEAMGVEDPFDGREPSFLFLDPPDHTRLRGLVSHAFTPRRVRELGPRIVAMVDEMLDEALARGGMDAVEDFAYPLPVRVICELLGVPSKDADTFKAWSRDLARGLDPDFMIPPDVRERQMRAVEGFRDYFEHLIKERTADPRDDLLSALIAAEHEGERLTHEELLTTLVLLLIAGHETTVNLIANGILQFGRHPEQYARLHADPGMARSAVEEVLRFDPPVQLSGRIAMGDVAFDGQRLDRGEQAICLLGAANRDPEAFENAETFDIGRSPNNHTAFGAGIHFCVGAPLARIEGQLAFEGLARKVGRVALDTQTPEYREAFVLRGLSSLPVSF